MSLVRLAKIALVTGVGFLFLLVGYNNLVDYGTNFDVVKHILAMDMIPPGPFAGRAVAVPVLQHFFYIGIIVFELAGGAATLIGAGRLWRARKDPAGDFNREKSLAIVGLASLFGLFFIGFQTIGGEWFLMWRAGAYNMQEPVFRFVGGVGLVLLFLNQTDGDL